MSFSSKGASPTALTLGAFSFLLAIISGALYVRKDYQAFISLGPGGTPQTFRGYLRIKVLSLFALRDSYAAIIPIPHDLCQHGCLKELPKRDRPRPRTRGIAPHRQVDQRSGEAIFRKLAGGIKSFAPGHNGDLEIGTSCFEKHGTGLFSTCPANRTCRGEIVHVHPSDGSMHMTLHPADANTVLEAGWGERHPLAGVFNDRLLPSGFIMLYAPQNDEEIEVVFQVVRAACWFVSEGDRRRKSRSEGDEAVRECDSTSTVPTGGRGNVRQVEDPDRALEKI